MSHQITPIRTREGFGVMTAKPFEPELTVPFVGSVLKMLRDELKGTGATLLGFVGLPFTLGSYLVEVKNPNTPFSRMWRPHFSHMSKNNVFLLSI